jgi:AcrR family transcriptional regulator
MPVEQTTEPTTLRRDAAANRARLIAAAIDVFNDEGIDAGVDRIAQRAGVGVGTLYRRFPTKDVLITFLVQEMLADLTAAAVKARTAPDGSGLHQFLRAAAARFATHRGCLQKLWKQNTASDAAIEGLRVHIQALVDDARTAGSVRPDIARADITMIMWALHGVIDNTVEPPLESCERLLSFVFAGWAPT